MELIDRQEAIKAIDDVMMEDEQYKVWLKIGIYNLKPVDAIPIEWINHYMDTRLTKGTLFYSCMSEFMRDWQKEQEKQNG